MNLIWNSCSQFSRLVRSVKQAICTIFPILILALAVLFHGPVSAQTPTVWEFGPGDVTFSKAAFANPTLPANQDPITANVIITRAGTQGIYNIAQEFAYDKPVHSSPADTEWAFADLHGNPSNPIASDVASLDFRSWATSLGGPFSPFSSNIVGRKGVAHLITDDIYFDVRFDAWGVGVGSGGSFTYTRAVPEPCSAILLALGGLLFIGARRKR